ncbi:MAG: spermine synthase [Bacteroidota bacterium]|nr:spermine synthase [Bacteroidota bacterium]
MISLIIAIIVMGFSGIVAQILILRELLVTFKGNELSIGMILANGLITEAFGSYFIGKQIEKIKNKTTAFVLFTILFSIFFIVTIWLIRIWKNLIGFQFGEGFGLFEIFYTSFIIILPVNIVHGALFTFGCRLFPVYLKSEQPLSIADNNGALQIGKVYIYETIGTGIGGIIFTYLLVTQFNSVQISLIIGLINGVVCLYLIFPVLRKLKNFQNVFLFGLSVVLTLFFLIAGFSRIGNDLHLQFVRSQWYPQTVTYYQNSIYGNVVVTQNAEQFTFFSDGIPIITVPTPDIVHTEEFAHIPMLFHHNPKDVLIISGGAGGIINEILKHKTVNKIDYAEIDPLLLKAVRKFPTPLTESEMNHPKVSIEFLDGRLFLKQTLKKYDMIFVGFSEPSDLQVNRLFTKEFFNEVSTKLNEYGILMITLPGSLVYVGNELKNLNKCIYNTLAEIFLSTKIIPGDAITIYLATNDENILLTPTEQIVERLQTLNLSLITSDYIEYKLHERWIDWFSNSIADGTKNINQDFKPLAVFYSLAYWNIQFAPYLKKMFDLFEKLDFRLFVVIILVVTLLFMILRLKIKTLNAASIPIVILTSGFAGMIFDLALIFSFQTLYGYVYYWIGLLVTAFMAGSAVGAMIMNKNLNRNTNDIVTFVKLEATIVIFAAIFPFVFILFHSYIQYEFVSGVLHLVFLVLSFVSGMLVGAQFPLANKICLDKKIKSDSIGKTAGLLYSADLVGGWFGGILGGVVLLPLLGLVETFLILVILKICSLMIIATSK